MSLAFNNSGGVWRIAGGPSSCDDSFGPFATKCDNGRFDFTLFFEQSIMSVLLSVLFLGAMVIRLAQLRSEKPKVRPHFIQAIKLVRLGCIQ
jgi:hypothetical protein